MKRSISILVILVSVISCFSVFTKEESVKAITQFTVEINPLETNTIADYIFRFSIEKTIKVHDMIKLVFPAGTTFTPPLPEEQEARKERMAQLMSCIQYIPPTESWKDPAPGIAFIEYETDGSIILRFFSHFEFNPEQPKFMNLVVHISKEAGITTPPIPGTYRFKIATSTEPTLIESQAVGIANAPFTVDVKPSMVSCIAEYEFQIPLRRKLRVHDWFCIVFPPGTTLKPCLPEEEKARQFRLKDIEDAFYLFGESYIGCLGLPEISFLDDGSMELKLHSPLELDPDKIEFRNILIRFSRKAGIVTPPIPGKVVFSFYTIQDQSPIHSIPTDMQNLTKFTVEVNPKKAGEVSELSFYCRFEKPLKVHDWIKIKLPPGTTFNPPIPEEEKARKERLSSIMDSIQFDCCCLCEVQGLPIITIHPDKSIEIKFNCPFDIETGNQNYTVNMILFSKEAGIVNPSISGSYQYYIASKNEPDYIPSKTVEIIDKVNFQATVCPRLTGKVAHYKFHVVLEARDNNGFRILFPPGTTLNPPLPEKENERIQRLNKIIEAITVENIHCPHCIMITITFHEDKSMELRISSGLYMGPKDSSYQESIIEIDESAGIVNPAAPGSVTFFFNNPQQTNLKESKPIELTDQKLLMEVSPRTPGSVARYQFVYIAEKSMGIHQWINFYFPPGTFLNPPLPTDEEGKKKRLKEIGSAIEYSIGEAELYQTFPIVETMEDGSLRLKISSALVFDPLDQYYRETVITITEKAGISLPQTSGNYLFYLALQNEPDKTPSQPVEVTDSIITPARVTLSNPSAGEPTGLDIQFSVGSAGELRFTEDFIYLNFPDSFQCSISDFLSDQPDYRYDMIFINDIPLLAEPDWSGSILALPVLQNIKAMGTVNIHIDQRYGFTNPFEEGTYTIQVNTSVEKEPIISQPFQVKKSDYSARLGIYPPKTGTSAWISLTYFNNQDEIAVDEIISITFPEGFYLPGPICCGEGVKVQNEPSNKLNFVGQTMEISCPTVIEPKTLVKIAIGPGTAIETPKQPGNYSFLVTHQKFKTQFTSNPVKIEELKLEILQVTLSKPNSGEIVEYAIMAAFHPDRIPVIGDIIQIKFGFLEPIPWIVEEKFAEKTIIKVPGIQNPSPGYYPITLEYGTEKAELTDKILILPALPELSYQLIGGKQGNHGWYREPPNVSFISEEANTQIFYGYDIMDIQQRYFSEPGRLKWLLEGCYQLDIYCYAKSPYGKSDIQTIRLKIDTVQPSFYIRLPENKTTITNQKTIKISGNADGTKIDLINEGKTRYLIDQNLTISGKPIAVDLETGTFTTDWELQEGLNLITIRLEDEAGNVSQQKYQVTLDTTPPEIKLDSPKTGQVWLTDTLILAGYAGYKDPAILVTINGTKITPNQIGFFEMLIPLKKLGPYSIAITATDEMNNTSELNFTVWFGYTIQLTIGKTKASVNQQDQLLTTPPLIQNGRTLVPFRFIGEAIEIHVDYLTDPVSKKVTHVYYSSSDIKIVLVIGSIYATVNGKTVQMEVSPQIIKGSTMVPLRFVAENLGFHVQWNPKDQTIRLQYPKKFADAGQ